VSWLESIKKRTDLKLIRIVAIYLGAAFATIIAIIIFLFLFCPDVFFNGYIKHKIEFSYAKSNPGFNVKIGKLRYKFWNNKIETDTICFYKGDTILMERIIGCNISGVKCMHLINGGPGNDCSGYASDAKDVYITTPESGNEMHFKNIHLSVNDSLILAEDFEYHPKTEDETFFASNTFRQTRFKIKAPSIKLSGVDIAGLINGKKKQIRSAIINKLSVDVLLNKEKPFKIDSAINPMPNEIFNKMKIPLQIDNILIENGSLTYNERYAIGGKSATLTFDKINISANETIDPETKLITATINGNCLFNNSTTMNLSMAIPLNSNTFSFKYAGTFGNLNLNSLNNYLEIAEPMKIKSGVLKSASFDVDINSGYATGTVTAIYTDLKIEPTDVKKFLSRKKINSRLANRFMIHKNNLPDKKGNIKSGEINFVRAHDTAFMEMVWLSLRSGIEDISGI
jgi:hypothetical protein